MNLINNKKNTHGIGCLFCPSVFIIKIAPENFQIRLISFTAATHKAMALLALCFLVLCLSSSTVYSIGVNYGTLANNLPPPAQVVNFLKAQTTIDRVKIFDTNPDILRAFANSGILVSVTVGNGDIVRLTNLREARRWVKANIKPFHPQTRINYIAVGNEVLHWGDDTLKSNLVPAMRSIHNALVRENVSDIKVSSQKKKENCCSPKQRF